MTTDFDVVVVGAGLAGLQCTRLLAGHGLRVALLDRKQSLEHAVHTTGIFVRRSLEDFSLPPAFLGPAIRHVTLYSPARRTLELESPHEEFRLGEMGALYNRWLKDCRAAGAQWLPGATYVDATAHDEGSVVRMKINGVEQALTTRFVVGADGTNSRVARDLNLSTNRKWIVGLEEVFEDVPLSGPPRLHCFLDRKLAPGYIAWVAEDGRHTHVGVGGYPARFQVAAALDAFRASLASVVRLRGGRLVDRRGGRIPVGGVLSKLAQRRGLLLGDAAGAVSPLTAGGLDQCLRMSELAAKVIWKFLSTGDPAQLAAFDGRVFGAAFRGRRWMRTAYAWGCRNPLMESGCAVLRSSWGRTWAQQVFFGRGSFPDAAEETTSESASRNGNLSQGRPAGGSPAVIAH